MMRILWKMCIYVAVITTSLEVDVCLAQNSQIVQSPGSISTIVDTGTVGTPANEVTAPANGVIVTNQGTFTTTTILSSTPTTGTYGQSIVLSAAVSTSGSNQPTGTVVFSNNGSSIGSASLAAGVATITATLPRGSNSYSANYGGDSNNLSSTSAAVSVVIVESVSSLTGNNTAACPSIGTLPAYCQQAYLGQSDTRSGVETVNYDPVAGNVSGEDAHSYLTDGSGTKILASLMIGFCTSPSTFNTTTNVQNCNANVLTGYTSNDSNTVAVQVQDLARRHIDGAVLTWSDGGSSGDAAALKFQSYLDNNYCNSSQVCTMSYVNQFNETLEYPTISVWTGKQTIPACVYGQAPTATDALYESCVVTEIENDMCYLNAAHFGNEAYLKSNGHPVLPIFQYETGLPATGAAPSWADVWNQIAAWNSNIVVNCSGATYGGFNYSVNNGPPLLVFAGQTGLYHTDTSGAFYWVEPDTGAPANQNIYNITTVADTSTTSTLDYFYQQATGGYLSLQSWGGAFKGFNDVQSSWGGNRMIDQQCGMTWIDSLTESNKYYTSSAIPYIEIVTWNDYNEGTSIESGIDNCYTVSASVNGSTLSWSLNPATGTTPNLATVSHIEIYDSPDGTNFTLLGSQTAATSGSYSLSTLPNGIHQLYAYMVGKNSILNRISSGVPYSNFLSTTTLLSSSVASVIPGQAVTLTARVSGSGTTPTGTVTFTSTSTGQNSGLLATVQLVNGVATYFGLVWVGTDTITAIYNGDTTYTGSTSSAVTVVNASVNGKLSFNWPYLNWGKAVAYGDSSSAWPVTLQNLSGVKVAIPSLTLTGAGAVNFQISSNDCTGSLPQGATCTFSVIFTPVTGGTVAGAVTAATLTTSTTTSASYSNSIAVTGLAVSSSLSFNWPFVNFQPQIQGSTGTNLWPVTVTNQSGQTLTGVTYTFTAGANYQNNSFTLTNTCSTLATGASCTFDIAPSPVSGQSAGTYSATLVVSGMGGAVSYNSSPLSVTDIVIPSGYAINWNQDQQGGISTIDFGPQNTKNIQSGPWPITVYNNTPTVETLTLTPSLNVFTIDASNNTCTSSIPAGGSCSFGLDFKPTADTSYQGTLKITGSVSGSYTFNTWGGANK